MYPLSFYRKIGIGTYFINLICKYVFRINKYTPIAVHYTSRFSCTKQLDIIGNSTVLYKCFACSPSLYIQSKNGIVIDSSVNLAPGVKIISANHDLHNLKKHTVTNKIMISKDVWIGANSIILPGVSIGKGSVIGAGSVVVKSLPDNVVAVGNPCKVIKHIC